MTQKLIKTKLPIDGSFPANDQDATIVHTVEGLREDWRVARSALDLHWRECWATYFGTHEAEDWLRNMTLHQTLGDVGKDWRHKISQAKAYDVVETAIPYFKSATFPNEDWFDLRPVVPIPGEDVELFVRIMKAFIKSKLDTANFKRNWEVFLRQLCITGTSVISLPWRMETKHTTQNILVRGTDGNELIERNLEKIVYNAPDMVVEDIFDIWLDPDSDDPNTCDFIRRFTLRRGEITRLIRDGVYPKATVGDVKRLKAWRRGRGDERNDVDNFYHVETSALTTDVIEIFEFWGTLEVMDEELYDVVITWSGNTLLRVESNPYRGGRPFVFGRYTPIVQSPYGWGMLSPVLGNLHELNTLANCRLDGLEVTLQPTMLLQNDGTADPADITVEPGKVISVGNIDGVRQLIMNNDFAAVSIQEEQLREEAIERRTGTSSFVGTAPGRSGERVTASEVEATQSAGGSRLSGVYENIEREALYAVIQKCYDFAQQFQSYDEIVSVHGEDAQEILYAQVGMEQLAFNMQVIPIGAKHIANKEYGIRQLTDWLAVVNSTPQLAQYINWHEVAREVTRKFVEENPERFVMSSEQMQGPAQQPGLADAAQQVGGNEFGNAVQSNILADGGLDMMAGQAKGLPTMPTNMTPEEQQFAQENAPAINLSTIAQSGGQIPAIPQ